MSRIEDGKEVRELIIIRRNGGDDMGSHKGGAWKIAYADFVTAMMAFFIVMWLINSANEATKARVASYFNPIKMTDATPSGRGLSAEQNAKKTEKKGEVAAESSADAKETNKNVDKKETENGHKGKMTLPPEEALLASPFQALDKLSTTGEKNPSGQKPDIETQRAGDPFDPLVWDGLRKGTYDEELPRDGVVSVTSGTDKDIPSEVNTENGDTTKVPEKPDTIAERVESPPIRSEKMTVNSKEKAEKELADVPGAKESRGTEISEAISAQLRELQRENKTFAKLNFEVKITSEGVLVILEDGKSASMFQIGSAEPNPELISFIGRIGQLLEQQDGNVVVRGHTDARQFQGKKFDNWQLSTSRAHMASYMLIRGGLAESRILKIEGYGAASLLDSKNPLADINRRVEILLVPGV